MTEIVVHRQFSSKRYDTFACMFPLNGNRVFISFKVRRDTLPPEEPLKLVVRFDRKEEEKPSA
jgi:hypothetical protein